MIKISNIKQILERIKLKPAHIVLPTVFSLLASLFEGIFAALMIPLINGMVNRNFAEMLSSYSIKYLGFQPFPGWSNTNAFIVMVAAILCALLARNIFIFEAKNFLSLTARKGINETRKYLFNEFISVGKMFFDKNSAGQLQNVLISYLNTMAGYLMSLQASLTAILMLVVYFVILIKISWYFAAIIVVLFPLVNYSYSWLIQKIKVYSKKYALMQRRLSSKVFNILSGVQLIKAYTFEENEKAEFRAISDKIQEIEYGLDRQQGFFEPSYEVLFNSIILLLVCGIYVAMTKYKLGNIGVYVVFLYILKKASGNLGVFNSIKSVIAHTSGISEEITGLLAEKEKYLIPDGSKEFKEFNHNISVRHLTFSYDRGVEVLNGINLSIDKGKKTAIVGPSGAGKSTLINLILRFYDCGKGMIMFDGTDIREFSLKSLRKKIALVSQDTTLFNESLRYNLLYGITEQVTDKELTMVLKKARLEELISKLPDKLDTLIGDRGINLSGGEKQRVAIARAILKNAEILILDEATSSLDSNNERLVHEAIEEAMKDRTAIAIAHRLSTIKSADKIVVIENGKLIEEGDIDKLLSKKGKFYQYWEQQKFY